jgi:hypothetical protein
MNPQRMSNLTFPLPRSLASLPTMVFSAGRHDFTNQSSCPIHPAWMRSFTANTPLLPHPPLSQVFCHLLQFLFLAKKNLSSPLSKNPCLQRKLKHFTRDQMVAAHTSISQQRSLAWMMTHPSVSFPLPSCYWSQCLAPQHLVMPNTGSRSTHKCPHAAAG